MMPSVYFYLPQRFWPDALPRQAGEAWPGYVVGMYAWTIQTYLWLRERLACELVDTLPSEGIVLVHRNSLRAHTEPIQPHPERLLVCLQGDLPPYPQAQIHVVQNPFQGDGRYRSFLPHWPQPGLIPRDPSRGERFDTVAFFGHQDNLAGLGDDWVAALARLGLQWQPRLSRNCWNQARGIHQRWHDYSDVDVVMAVRGWGWRSQWRTRRFRHKPATKLYNGWLAGVPVIAGLESAYRAERQSPLDYIEVKCPEDCLEALLRLQQETTLRRAMTHNAYRRSQAVRPDAIAHHWLAFFQEVAFPAYARWRTQSDWGRLWLIQRQQLAARWRRLESTLRSRVF